MEISGKILREVEFRDRLRGYDTDEVDEFLEKVAIAVDEMQAELARLSARGPTAQPAESAPVFDDDSIRRTLVLAQRTADLAVSEAREEADRILEAAQAQAEAVVSQAHEAVRRLRDDAEQEVHERVGRLEADRERLEREAGALAALLDGERARLTESLGAALRFVEESFGVPGELARAAGARRPGEPASATGPVELVPGAGGTSTREDEPRRDGGSGDAPVHAPVATPPATPPAYELPDVEAEIDADAALAIRPADPPEPPQSTGGPSPVDWSPPPSMSSVPALDADEALWARWAAGGSIDAPAVRDAPEVDNMVRFDRFPGGRPAS
ncbi:MAG TPA: DivIVA domain-containing protein [Acidimicrobiales bacterium]|nr:DivIVA domain-containing protein [Acidimicrobiales bacterium]